MCDCINLATDSLIEKFGDTEAHIRVSYSANLVPFPVGMEARVRLRTKNNGFVRGDKYRSIPIIPAFCPFCGEKYDKDKPDEHRSQQSADVETVRRHLRPSNTEALVALDRIAGVLH